jgi:hypothetical protein
MMKSTWLLMTFWSRNFGKTGNSESTDGYVLVLIQIKQRGREELLHALRERGLNRHFNDRRMW